MNKIDKGALAFGAAAGVICVLLVIIGGMFSNKIEQLQDIHDNRVAERAQLIEKVKNDCKIIHKDIDYLASTTYTYRCKDGIEYSFSEGI